jgi:hypothetical protein
LTWGWKLPQETRIFFGKCSSVGPIERFPPDPSTPLQPSCPFVCFPRSSDTNTIGFSRGHATVVAVALKKQIHRVKNYTGEYSKPLREIF